jgi:hypothetical protein
VFGTPASERLAIRVDGGRIVDLARHVRLGTDDWITKPFTSQEFLARFDALVLRARGLDSGTDQSYVAFGDLEIDFFDYPDDFSAVPPAGESCGFLTPFYTYYFRVQLDSGAKELWWEDELWCEDVKADKLRELIDLIWDIVKSEDEYKALPEPTGGYM